MPVVLNGTHMHVYVCVQGMGQHAVGACGGWGIGVCGRHVCVHVVEQVYV